MYHSLLIYLPTEGQLDYLQVWAVTNKVAISIHVQVSVWTYIFSLFEKIPRRKCAGPSNKSMFNFVQNCQTVFLNGCTICIPTSNKWEFLLPPFSPAHSVSTSTDLAIEETESELQMKWLQWRFSNYRAPLQVHYNRSLKTRGHDLPMVFSSVE